MKRLIILTIAISMFSCGSVRQTESKTNNDSEEFSLPPNTASNKYSKKRKSSGI